MAGRAPVLRVGHWLLVGVVLVWSLAPYLWTLATSFKTERELYQFPVTYWPHAPTIVNYVAVFTQNPFGRFLLNSALVTVISTVACLFIAALAAYAFARLRFRGREALLVGLLIVAMIPLITVIVPLYILVRNLGLLNSYAGLVAPYVTYALPVAIFILTAFFREIPQELEEAALIDGCTRLNTLWRIIAPLAAPGLITAGIIVFVYTWNEFLVALTLTSTNEVRTITVGIALYRGEFTFPWGVISAAVTLATIPIMVLILLGQRLVIRGLTAGAVKG
ncbi:MAG: carbohydrate ABC transporter permease [Armatimonadota bacterium]|nr:carbohydrate ABC transporter permease [Armatimonadota bacterium]MDR7423148.1 carbohydrate ABC transporter permease [Armatimonadota bacterium]MDR7455391.1 carbohydrate ABC transporter permease [Armatimonadota bacterium]MDR7457625.1 carbohydrate ABC transporter permease [Armatimonadota bacterium]MDR7496524.1 carbohydrate ABC transporter permease [Armatimonadota bacterium]